MSVHRQSIRVALGFLIVFVVQTLSAGEVQRCAIDDMGKELCLPAPAQRIITLSPGATELTFAAGAGAKVVAVVNYSDYPPEALKLPLVGSHTRVDMEALLALKPDLVVTWVTGNPPAQIELLGELGIPMFAIEPRTFEGVSSVIERLATLAGTEQAGLAEAERFRVGIAALSEQYRNAEPIPVFYQVWEQPLMTINNDHLIGKVLQLCGGVNVFGEMPRLVPRISSEVVLQADPHAILTGSVEGVSDGQLDSWKQYSELTAVKKKNLFFVPASPISRPTPRLLEATRIVCDYLDSAREH
ncbi:MULTISPECIES: cobalamin-binding protein [unclassified Marinobacter]|uniref:cobalamin-binding protein n=1 Tax=unclassified Marinobacter TaxID=83889 RepID=UPI0026E3402B|nr:MULTISPECIES: cobalamin-binding protein [unclassified Marinobacter]MDO6443266.1 cobalamin-binding protein [Marinobacter sp. 2_MG-2023]MDO6824336.1 cobalamin-binding protein [Marinobacter sp. 1_MG-2023]